MGEERVIPHGDLQRARLNAMRLEQLVEYKVERLAGFWRVSGSVKTLARWRKVADFYCAHALADFLAASLGVEDHLPTRRPR